MATWVCIGSGPSLTFDDVEYCRQKGWNLATCNNSLFYAPDTKVHHAFDLRWWDTYYELARQTGAEMSTCFTTAASKYRIKYLAHKPGGGWADNPNYVYQGGPMSGYNLIQIVGNRSDCDRIILLGYDMKLNKKGHTNFHERHPIGWPTSDQRKLEIRLRFYKDLAREAPIEIINASRDTAIEVFTRMKLDSII